MMQVSIDLRKNLQQNAALYYERSKKAKKKLQGAEKAIEDMKKKIQKIQKEKLPDKEQKAIRKRKKQWFEKFHWFQSSDGLLVIGGRDTKSNETVVKRYMQPDDLYLHADIQGAPHVVVKSEGKAVPESTKQEAAIFAAVFSRAWKDGLASVDVYSVKPNQVSKKTKSGESMPTGAFMIYGERKWFRKTPMTFAIGVQRERENYIIVSGPISAVKKNVAVFFKVVQGSLKKSEVAKRLKVLIEEKLKREASIDLDELIAMLPAGGLEIVE